MKRAFFSDKKTFNSASSLLPSEQPEHLLTSSSSHVRENLSIPFFVLTRYMITDEPGTLNPVLLLNLPNKGFQYSFSPSPMGWGTPLFMGTPEPDDYLHNPDPRRDRKNDFGVTLFTARGASNLGCLTILCLACLMLL